MAKEYYVHKITLQDGYGNLFDYQSDYINENLSVNEEYDTITPIKKEEQCKCLSFI
jgi:hypothetical protein